LPIFRYFFKKKIFKFCIFLQNSKKFTTKHSLNLKNFSSALRFNNKKTLKNRRKLLTALLKKKFFRIFINFNQITRLGPSFAPLSSTSINFLRKEKIYTKLKYSRVPQYDIASGATAALLAGFLGFLICEKFGFELLDSGDFYFLFMYLVFFFFFMRLFYKTINFKRDLSIFNRFLLFIDFAQLVII
jgi:hypothetical protein